MTTVPPRSPGPSFVGPQRYGGAAVLGIGTVHGADGLFVLGQRDRTGRSPNFIDGVRHDAAPVSRRMHQRHPSRVAA